MTEERRNKVVGLLAISRLESKDMRELPCRWIEKFIGSGAKVSSLVPLIGATSSAVYGVEVSAQTGSLSLVLRLFDNAEWLAEEPELARHEAWGLNTAAKAETPTPELVAFDETGEECGLPAVLMTRREGCVELQPGNSAPWLQEMAEAIASVHRLEVEEAEWRYFSYNDAASLSVPEWSAHPENWARAIEIVQRPEPICPQRFIHRDYHPNNVLWAAGKVSGIVDWPNACLGPVGIDVAWCRQNLAQLHGAETADAFLKAYQTASGSGFAYDPYWDLRGCVEFLPGPPGVYPGWTAQGVSHLTLKIVRERLENYLASILARC